MKWRVVTQYDPEVDAYAAFCPELPGCTSAGYSEEEARRNIKEAIRLYLEPSSERFPESATVSYVTV